MPSEIELKLAVEPTAVARLLRHSALRLPRREKTRTAHVVSTYFDCPEFRLQRDDVALRVRRVGRRWIQTIKGPPQSGAGAGLHVRAEYEWPLRGPNVDVSLLATTPWRKLVAKAAKAGGLVPCFTTEFERKTIPLAFPDGTVAELCVDLGEIRAVRDGRTRRAAIAEIEIELKSGDVANVFRLALALCEDLPLAVMTDTKASRGYALRRGAMDAPVRASAVALPVDATTADALSAVAHECLHQIAANGPGLIAGGDPEWIHQMRVGTRRLRSCLSLVTRFAVAAPLDPVMSEIKWLARILGTARDWDVFATETLPPLAAWYVHDENAAPGIRRLRARVAARRKAAGSAARAAVASSRFQRLVLTAELACATTRFGAPLPAGSGTGASPDLPGSHAAAFAARLLARRHRKFARLAGALLHGSNEERHAARIAAKRLRYAAEFFAPLFPRKRTRTYLSALADVQDVLGRFNDAATAARLASELGGTTDDAAAGSVRGWAAAQAVALDSRMAKAWRRIDAAKPFWPQS